YSATCACSALGGICRNLFDPPAIPSPWRATLPDSHVSSSQKIPRHPLMVRPHPEGGRWAAHRDDGAVSALECGSVHMLDLHRSCKSHFPPRALVHALRNLPRDALVANGWLGTALPRMRWSRVNSLL